MKNVCSLKFNCLFCLLFFLNTISCYRDNHCYCLKKKGAKIIYVIQTKPVELVIEKLRYFPTTKFETDTGHYAHLRALKIKYDTLKMINNASYSIGVVDSFRNDTQLNVLGYETKYFREKGYDCLCLPD